MPAYPVQDTATVKWACNPKTVSQALDYAAMQQKSRNPIWYRRCLAFVGSCYGVPFTGTPYAIDLWSQMPPDMRHTSSSGIPTGALLLYRTNSRAGHIALYAGGGQVYSTDIIKNGCVDLVEFNDLIGGIWKLDYVGWTPPYFPKSHSSKICGTISFNATTAMIPNGSGDSSLTPSPSILPPSIGAIGDAINWASDAKHWINLLLILIGIIMILTALIRMSSNGITKAGTKLVKGIIK